LSEPPPSRPPLVNDDLLEQHAQAGEAVYRLYEPQSTVVVLGAGRKLEEDVCLSAVQADGVPVLRRRGGGGTVVLSPGQAVLALVTEVASPFRNREYFRRINEWFRETLSALGVSGIEHRGISDLALGERKILGTSLYRRRQLLFYQASLLVSPELSLFDRYLTFPSRVPDYRRGRPHSEFCTTLAAEGYPLSVARVLERLVRVVEERLPELA
jgi:lipoate-protein ligase A